MNESDLIERSGDRYMSEPAPRESRGTAVAIHGGDPYSALGAKLDQDGLFLKFSKGEYLYGQNKEELRLGKRLVVNVPGMRLGWVRWKDGKRADDRMELLTDGRRVEARDELGDTDESLWELDDRGEPQDPWVLTYSFEMSDPANGEVYQFATTSVGGKKAVGKLLKAFGAKHRMEPHLLPIIELQRDSYNHSNPRFGKIYNPLLPVVGWTDAENPSVEDLGEAEVLPFDAPDQRAANPTAAGRSSASETAVPNGTSAPAMPSASASATSRTAPRSSATRF